MTLTGYEYETQIRDGEWCHDLLVVTNAPHKAAKEAILEFANRCSEAMGEPWLVRVRSVCSATWITYRLTPQMEIKVYGLDDGPIDSIEPAPDIH